MANYPSLLESFRKVAHDEKMYEELFDRFKSSHHEEADSCIAVGPGPGLNELSFLRKFAPQLQNLICVEKDESCVVALKENLKRQLPKNVKAEVVHTAVQDWEGPKEKVDIVLAFNCLYFDEKQRVEVLRKCMHEWLKPLGCLYVMMLKDVKEGESHVMNEVFRRHGLKTITEAFHLKKNIMDLGFKLDEESSYYSIKPLDHINPEFVSYLKLYSKPKLTENQIKETLKNMHEEGFQGRTCGTLFSVKKESVLF